MLSAYTINYLLSKSNDVPTPLNHTNRVEFLIVQSHIAFGMKQLTDINIMSKKENRENKKR